MRILAPFLLAFVAALGNAMVAFGQQKAKNGFNPYWFGGASLLIAGIILLVVASFGAKGKFILYLDSNYQFILVSSFGFVVLNVFLNMLYQNYGTSYYTLYSTLAILTTSIGVAYFMFHEKMNYYYYLSIVFAVITIFLFMKAKNLSLE